MTIDVPSLVAAAGGEIVGKIRLQKIVYLLDRLGIDSGFSFEYHYYGPYSADLAEQVYDDIVFKRLKAETRRRQTDGVPYTVYQAEKPGEGDALDRKLLKDKIVEAIETMKTHSSTVLELAATIHWLAEEEKLDNWHDELVVRKGVKTQNGREQKALDLLEKLGLRPPVSAEA